MEGINIKITMQKMKSKILGSLIVAAGLLTVTSCEDYFDDVPNNATSLEDIFSNRGQALGWLTNLYSITPDNTNRYAGGTAMYWGPATIEGYLPWDWVETHDIIQGTMYSSTSWVERIWSNYYRGIQNANIYLANIDNCKAMPDDEKETTKAEVRALRAYFYLNLVKEYGPVPLIGDMVSDVADPLQKSQIARSPIDSCFNYIISEFKSVLDGGHLLSQFDGQGAYNSQTKGNFTKEAVEGFLADAYLFRASYLFNGDPYYKDLANADGTKLFPQERDDSKWRDARDAAKKIIDEGKFSLVYRDVYGKKVSSVTESCPFKSTFYASMASSDNEELIYGRPKSSNETYAMVPRFGSLGSSYDKGGGAYTVPLEFVDLYFTNKGVSIDDDPDYFTYDTSNPPTAARGDKAITNTKAYKDPISGYQYFSMASSGGAVTYSAPTSIMKQFYNREARFYLAITFQNRLWDFQGNAAVQMQFNGNSGPDGKTHDFPIFGTICRKLYYAKESNWDMSMVLRLGEIYLDYAEACAELGDYAEALKYVNFIRSRAGIPEYAVSASDATKDARGLDRVTLKSYDKETVLKAIYRERILELAYESKHYFDVRRWGVAEGKWRTDGAEMTDGWIYPAYHTGGEGGDMTGFNVNNVGQTAENKNVNFYKRIVQQTRVFTKRMSFFPIPQQEVNRDKAIVQTTGWESAGDTVTK